MTAVDVPAIQINVSGQYRLTGTLSVEDAAGQPIPGARVQLVAGNYVVVDAQGVALQNVSVVSDAQVVSLAGNIAVKAGSVENNLGNLIAQTGGITFDVAGSVINNGALSAAGKLSIQAKGDFNNADGMLYAADAINIDATKLVNSGSIYTDFDVQLHADTLNNAGSIGSGRG